MLKQTYIGDGVYVEFDGYGYWLKANDPNHPTDKIYLEPQVLTQLINFLQRCEQEQIQGGLN